MKSYLVGIFCCFLGASFAGAESYQCNSGNFSGTVTRHTKEVLKTVRDGRGQRQQMFSVGFVKIKGTLTLPSSPSQHIENGKLSFRTEARLRIRNIDIDTEENCISVSDDRNYGVCKLDEYKKDSLYQLNLEDGIFTIYPRGFGPAISCEKIR